MNTVRSILETVAAQEDLLRAVDFVAPCARRGPVRAHIGSLVYSFRPRPEDYEGWGVFRAVDETSAVVVGRPDAMQVMEYLSALPSARVVLLHPLAGRSWLAWPTGAPEGAARRERDRDVVQLVHLVTDGARFEPVVARVADGALWYERPDPAADPSLATALRAASRRGVPADALRLPGLTPELRAAYAFALANEAVRRARRTDDDA